MCVWGGHKPFSKLMGGGLDPAAPPSPAPTPMFIWYDVCRLWEHSVQKMLSFHVFYVLQL